MENSIKLEKDYRKMCNWIGGKDYIVVRDARSKAMEPTELKALVIGVRETEVELRINNHMTSWFPLNSDKVTFFYRYKA